MPQTLNIAVCEDEAAETVLLCDILNHSDIQNTYTVFTDADSFLAMLKKSDAPSLYVKRNKSMERLALSDIMYIEQRARQIFIHLKENEEISYYEKLSELSDQLPAELFFLPHKSYAVNLSYVTHIDTSLKCFVMADDTNIPIKRELSGKAKKALERYYFDHTRGLK